MEEDGVPFTAREMSHGVLVERFKELSSHGDTVVGPSGDDDLLEEDVLREGELSPIEVPVAEGIG